MKTTIVTQESSLTYLPLAEVKEHLRVTGTDSDAEITVFIDAAANILENYLGSYFRTTQYSLETNLLYFYDVNASIDSVFYRDAKATYAAIVDFDVDQENNKQTLVINSDISLYDHGYKYKFILDTGYTESALPPALKHCLKLLVHDLYEQRGDMLPVNLYKIPRGVEDLAFNYSVRVFV